MRFNHEDFKRGNISKERIHEIVEKTILKVDENFAKRDDILRNSTSLINLLDKQFIFKKGDEDEKEKASETSEFDKNLHTIKFFNSILKANIELIKFEIMMSLLKQEELHKQYLHHLELLESKKAQAHILEQDYQQQLINLRNEQFQAVLDAQQKGLARIDDLLKQREGLLEAIDKLEEGIREARSFYINEAIKYASEVEVNGRKAYEGQSPEQIAKNIKGMYEIEEVYKRTDMDIEQRIADLKRQVDEKRKGQPAEGMMTQFSHAKAYSGPEFDKLYAEKEANAKARLAAYTRLGDATGDKHINSRMPEEHRLAFIEAKYNHRGLGQQFEKRVENSYGSIIKERASVKDVEKIVVSEAKNLQKLRANISVKSVVLKNEFHEFQRESSISRDLEMLSNGFYNSNSRTPIRRLSENKIDVDSFRLPKLDSTNLNNQDKNISDLQSVKLSEMDFDKNLSYQKKDGSQPDRMSGQKFGS